MGLADGHQVLMMDGPSFLDERSEVKVMYHREYSELTVMYVQELSELTVMYVQELSELTACTTKMTLMTQIDLD